MQIGNVRLINIDDEMRDSYLNYAMSVIVARALPDVRDGLKPVQRRILYAMHDISLSPDKPHRKSARIVGEVLGKYHPHGELAVYDAMVRMAQPFSMRAPLVDGQGNFGSVDGDSPAAQRYTEARLTPVATELLADLDKNTVDFAENFDSSLKEPKVLPGALPNLLVNGAAGIAVGMATNIPPHNLGEVCDAITYLIDNYDHSEDVSVEDLMQFIQAPDFPTGAHIMGREGIAAAYGTGKGRVLMRAVSEIEEMRPGRYAIVFTEIPYQVNKSTLLEKMADLVRTGRIDSISDLRDESDRDGLRIVVELKRGAQPNKTLNQLYKWTPLQSAFSINMLALVDGQPRVLPLKRILQLYVQHRQEVITRRAQFDLEKAQKRAHILEGLLKALDQIDAVIDTIRSSADAEAALHGLMERFGLSEEQSRAILDMQLRRLASLERKRIQDEYDQVQTDITRLRALLGDPHIVLDTIKGDLLRIKQLYSDERRSVVRDESAEPFMAEDLIMDEPVLISITRRGYVKRLPTRTYRVQNRGGKGVTGAQTGEEDDVEHFFSSSNLSMIYYLTNRGRLFARMAHLLPDASRTARGTAIINLIPLEDGERITAAVSIPRRQTDGYLCMITRLGRLKRVAVSEFASVRMVGIRAVSLEGDDELAAVQLTTGQDDLVIVSKLGRALRFHEQQAPAQGRTARGVMTMMLQEGDAVAGLEVVEGCATLLLVTEHGFGKRVLLDEYPAKGRRGHGMITLKESVLDKTGAIVCPRVVGEADEVTIMTTNGMVMSLRATDISTMGRYAAGTIVMRLNGEDTVASVARIRPVQET
ncbi:MAG: DNA gyrase subunit A [Anaerolineae bacterium]